MNNKILVAAVVLLLVVAAVILQTQQSQPRIAGEAHLHADFKVYINGNQINFSQEEYQSSESRTLSPFVHLHDGDGEVIHVHARGVTLGEFFNSIGMNLNSTCIEVDKQTYCTGPTSELQVVRQQQPQLRVRRLPHK